MKVTNFDERNIKYFAGRYCCNQAPFEDLVQEGWLAALSASQPEHKYLAIRKAIQVYKRRALRMEPTAYKDDQPEESRELQMIEDLEHLQYLMTKTTLSPKELECIQLVYYGDGLTFEQAGEKHNVSKQAMHLRHDSAMRKLRATARQESNDAR